MTRAYSEKLAAVDGTVIPSKVPAGQQPWKHHLFDPDKAQNYSKSCVICGSGFSTTANVRSHFVACVMKNGNPTGARWHQNINYKPPQPKLRLVHQSTTR